MDSTLSRVVVSLALLAPFGDLHPPAQTLASTAAQPKAVLVELFTSEGCSSCPPADALLRQLSGTRTASGQLIVGISEHVTYWNSLGWADPFSSEVYTGRQNAYGERFNLDSVYTPQMVVNGAEQLVGSDKARLTRAIDQQLHQPAPITLRILSVHPSGARISVTFSADGEIPPRGAEIIAVLADDADTSSVLRGENSGRTLAHVAVARSLQRVTILSTAGQQTVEINVLPSLPQTQARHLVLFAQAPGHGRVLGVATAPV